ncbi:hypothetical protein Pmani_027245 [Petrolisthes manimaculis]|uniref:Uncharacterized protein n=1 Tax=Petrolisthes manimaculis TaxID=1843537 RepID=A0AAE1P4E3_9EUCA|nr:hypothetical protein Pmani_027245 [Petrolisthes manimaculis]
MTDTYNSSSATVWAAAGLMSSDSIQVLKISGAEEFDTLDVASHHRSRNQLLGGGQPQHCHKPNTSPDHSCWHWCEAGN